MSGYSDVINCPSCNFESCDFYDYSGEHSEYCALCGYEVMPAYPPAENIQRAEKYVEIFKIWCRKRGIEEPTDYQIGRTVENGFQDTLDDCSEVERSSTEWEKLEAEALKIFYYFYFDGKEEGCLTITEKRSVENNFFIILH